MCLQHTHAPCKHTGTNSATSLKLYRLDLLLLVLLLLLLLRPPAASLRLRRPGRHRCAVVRGGWQSYDTSEFGGRKRGKRHGRMESPRKRSEASPPRPAGRLLPLQHLDTQRVPGVVGRAGGLGGDIFARQIFMGEIFFIMHILNYDFKYWTSALSLACLLPFFPPERTSFLAF